MCDGGNGGGGTGYGIGESDVFSESPRGAYTDVYGMPSYTIGGPGAPAGYGIPGYAEAEAALSPYTGIGGKTAVSEALIATAKSAGEAIPGPEAKEAPQGIDVGKAGKGAAIGSTVGGMLGPGGTLAGALMGAIIGGMAGRGYAPTAADLASIQGYGGGPVLGSPTTVIPPAVTGKPVSEKAETISPEGIQAAGQKAAKAVKTKARERFGRLAARIVQPGELSNPFIYIPTLR